MKFVLIVEPRKLLVGAQWGKIPWASILCVVLAVLSWWPGG